MTLKHVTPPPAQPWFDVEVGAQLPELVWRPTAAQLFRFSAVTWNAHRIHYGKDAAFAEGYPDILVQAHLHGAMLARMVTEWVGSSGRLAAISWENRGIATPADLLICSGIVTGKSAPPGEWVLDIDIQEKTSTGAVIAEGRATVRSDDTTTTS